MMLLRDETFQNYRRPRVHWSSRNPLAACSGIRDASTCEHI